MKRNENVFRRCLICGIDGSALRLFQGKRPLRLRNDGGRRFTIRTHGEISIFYLCDASMGGCGSLYSTSYDRTGDEAEVAVMKATRRKK